MKTVNTFSTNCVKHLFKEVFNIQVYRYMDKISDWLRKYISEKT